MGVKHTNAVGVKPGDTIMMEGAPCRVSDVSTSRPGKHGHAKCRISGVGIVDDKRRIIVLPGHDRVEVPIIEKKNAQVLSVSGNKANLMDMESYETFDLEIPEELKDKVKDGVQILYWQIMESKMMKQVKGV